MSKYGEMPAGGRKRVRAKRAKRQREYAKWLKDYAAWNRAVAQYAMMHTDAPLTDREMHEEGVVWEPWMEVA